MTKTWSVIVFLHLWQIICGWRAVLARGPDPRFPSSHCWCLEFSVHFVRHPSEWPVKDIVSTSPRFVGTRVLQQGSDIPDCTHRYTPMTYLKFKVAGMFIRYVPGSQQRLNFDVSVLASEFGLHISGSQQLRELKPTRKLLQVTCWREGPGLRLISRCKRLKKRILRVFFETEQ